MLCTHVILSLLFTHNCFYCPNMADTGTGCIPTASEINGAKIKVLKHMITVINEERARLEPGKVKGLSKQGNIAELRKRVAD